jgi:TolB protein
MKIEQGKCMKKMRFLITGWLCAMVMLAATGVCAKDYGYIYITNPFVKKIPIAIPAFQSVTKSFAETEVTQKSTDLLTETLLFTSFFALVDRGSYLVDPKNPDLNPDRINFINWRVVNADLLVTGSVELSQDILQMDLRLFDTVKEQNLISKRYTGTQDQYRQMIRLFCSHVISHLTGKDSIFNTKIMFVSNATGNKELYMCDFDGYNVSQFTHNQNIALFPAWSRDGQWVAYTSYKSGRPDLYIRHIRENRGVVVAKEGINTTPAWVPNKFELAATQSYSGDQEIYLLTGDGKMIKRLTHNSGIDTSPTFSPDGKKMAFVSKRSGSPQIYIMDVDSNNTRRLTFEGNNNTQPDWSPSGDKIAYTSMESGQTNIRVINVDGSGLRQLTQNAGNNESASWSPDGNLLVFSSTREGKARIYVMTAFGTDQRRLLNLPGAQTNPKWSPRLGSN